VQVSVQIIAATIGAVFVGAAVAANRSWLDRHFLPSFFVPRPWYVLIENAVRIAIATLGALLALGRTHVARLLTRAPIMALQVAAAALLAILASEFVVRRIHFRPTEWLVAEEEPRRQPDPRLGWVLTPSRTGATRVGGRTLEYAIDAAGYRVRRMTEAVDPERPTILFAGESVMFGEGLTWDESIPARTAAMLGVQSANLAVHGYSNDQAYLRLARELPRFRHPLAIVSIFMTELFGRNLDDDRPHLAPGLAWQPAEQSSRLMSLASLLVPFRRDATVEQGVRVTREVLGATMRMAHARGAAALVVVPQFGFEGDAQRALRERILTDDVPNVVVPLDPDWRLPWDRHPNARAAHVIATAIAAELHREEPIDHRWALRPARRAPDASDDRGGR
jgi:hypothetical protein